MTNADKQLAHHIIAIYRDLVAQRYQYDELLKHTDVPSEITPEVVANVRHFFLYHVYPEAEERDKLEEAFNTLSNYVRQPAKVWGLLGNMASAIFTFGRHLPAALKAGVVSLESFLAARRLEEHLVAAAKKENHQIPITQEQFKDLIAHIPVKEMKRFVNDIYSLFKTMSDTVLLKKTIHIMNDVIERMKKKPTLYPATEIEGIRLGISILEAGYELFSQYDEATKELIAKKILENENHFLQEIYGSEW